MSAQRHDSEKQKVVEALDFQSGGRDMLEVQLESMLRNADGRQLIAPLLRAQAEPSTGHRQARTTRGQCRAALQLQEQWNAWADQRESLRNDLKRGKECLHQIQKDLRSIRQALEDWSAYERVCGRNPLLEYMQSLETKERLQQFLPHWLARREAQLASVTRQMEKCAKEHGLECRF